MAKRPRNSEPTAKGCARVERVLTGMAERVCQIALGKANQSTFLLNEKKVVFLQYEK